jgi:hypothetical protein
VRFTGTAARSFKALLAMCGEQALQNVVVVTNMWGKVTPEVGSTREQELANHFYKPALDRGAVLLRHDDTIESAHSIIKVILGKEQVTLQIQEEITDQRKRIEETAAGNELLGELNQQVDKRIRQLRELQEMLNQSEVDNDETRLELQQEVLRLREELATLRSISGGSIGNLRETVEDVFIWILVAICLRWVWTKGQRL